MCNKNVRLRLMIIKDHSLWSFDICKPLLSNGKYNSMNLFVTMQACNSIFKMIYFLIIRKESKFSRLKRALKENIDDAFTVSGDSEFHTLTTL